MVTQAKLQALRNGKKAGTAGWWSLDFEGSECFSHFIRDLGRLFEQDDVLVLKGDRMHPKVRDYLSGRSAVREGVFQLPLTIDNLHGLFLLSQRYTVQDICDWVKVLRQGTVILDGSDISGRACKVRPEIEERKVKEFCERVEATYSKA
jgi:hypothetical protein